MAKGSKADASGKKVPNRHIYARISYLHQASQYLMNQQYASKAANQDFVTGRMEQSQSKVEGNASGPNTFGVAVQEDDQDAKETEEEQNRLPRIENHVDFGLPRQLASHILLVSRKSVLKVSRDIKRSMCKRCNSVLISGQTAEVRLENKSRGGRKPWADVTLITCLACGMEKRYPVGADVRRLNQVQTIKKDEERQPTALGEEK